MFLSCFVCGFLQQYLERSLQELYEKYEAQEGLSRRTMKARLLWDAILESQVLPGIHTTDNSDNDKLNDRTFRKCRQCHR